jgi:TolB-like protein/Flp pilus assembly protein TadD
LRIPVRPAARRWEIEAQGARRLSSAGGRGYTFRRAQDVQMHGTDETSSQSGLPWPSEFADLQAQIRAQWAVEGEIYLVRQLSGGKSGALVYAADLDSRDFGGQAILKFDRYPDAADEPNEAEQHRLALQQAPDYAGAHLPRLVNTFRQQERAAILSTIAGRGLEYAEPWLKCRYDRQLASARTLSRGILDGWNAGYRMAEGLRTPQELLQGWLGYRLDPERGRIHGFLADEHGLTSEQASFVVDGEWLPNPLAFVEQRSRLPDHLQLRAATGNVHGDLHGYNVLVSTPAGGDPTYYLIDLALYQAGQYLFYDHAYFELTYLLALRDRGNPANWLSILASIEESGHGGMAAQGDDVGLVQLVDALRGQVFDWVDRREANRLSYMESQYLLARVAAGLCFAHRQISTESRTMAFLYAAHNLKAFLRHNDVDWPKYGPPFALASGDAKPAAEPEAAAAPEPRGPAPANAFTAAPAAAAAATGETADRTLPTKPAVAVMPFDNLGGDPEQDYLGDGITDDLVTDLSRSDWLTVISPRSTATYRGQTVDPRRIGQELQAHFVVSGSVRKAGDTMRVTAQLIDAETGGTVWADRFDRKPQDLFAAQDEIVDAIVANIDTEAKYTEREEARRKHGPLNAWESYQKGMWHFFKTTPEDDAAAIAQMEQAVRLAPDFANGEAMLSILKTRRLLFGASTDPAKDLADGFEHAEKAITADDRSAVAHIALGRVLAFRGQLDESQVEMELAVRLNPSSAAGYLALAGILYWKGLLAEALKTIDQAARLSPRDPMMFAVRSIQALCHADLGNLSDAEAFARAAVRAAPKAVIPYAALVVVLVRQQRLEEARAVAAEMRSLSPSHVFVGMVGLIGYMEATQRERFLADLRAAGVGVPAADSASRG